MELNLTATKRKILFWIILVCIPFVLFLLLESGLRIFDYGDDLVLFLQGKEQYSDYMYINRWVAKRYFRGRGVPDPSNDVFLKNKPENGYRIFVLGGSTAAGWPYTNNVMFSRILQKRLSDLFPARYIEVVNTSISAINSYTYLDFTDEILDHDPDLILIYGGHNEFYGAFGVASTQNIGNSRWIKKMYLNLVHLKTFQLTGKFIQYLTSLFNSNDASGNQPSATLMERLVDEQNIQYGSELYQLGALQFGDNIDDLLNEYKNAGVPVILSDLVSNISDQPPFRSLGTSENESAKLMYSKSKKLEWEGKFEEAKVGYLKAKDLDALRFRATEDFNDIIREKAEKYDMSVVNMTVHFTQNSENGLIGNTIMLDHLHPNLDGQFLMADAFFQEVFSKNLISRNEDIKYYKKSEAYRNEWGYSILDSVYADMKIKHLKSGWPFIEQNTSKSNDDFKPKGVVETIAFRIWKDRSYTSEDGHAELAEYFESRGQFESAFHEYNALTCLKPLNSTAYLKAADASIKAGKMNRALPFLEQSLKLEETAFAYKWIGLIYLHNHDYEKAISNLEIVYDLEIKDVELFYNLGLAYFQVGKHDLTKKMLEDLKKLDVIDAQVTWMIKTLNKLLESINIS
jgi:tetratricopeptide (TPR) repeat protein